MSILDKKSEEFLFEYIKTTAATGHEVKGQKLWLEYIKPYIDEWHSDNYGTVYGVINPGQEYKVVIEAHADEISWVVNYIADDGYISVIRNGGSDEIIATSKRVNIDTPKGIVKGIFGWPAIHTRKGKNANLSPKLENIFVDVGAKDKDEVLEMGIHVGCIITYEDELMIMNDKYYVGRALDNRVGGLCIAEVAKLIKNNKDKLPYSLYIVNAVQEEVGLRGAEMIAQTIKPNVALVIDVCHDTNTPLVNAKKEGDTFAGKGPVLTYAPAVQNNLLKLLFAAAAENEIPVQRNASSRYTGTDTDAFAYSNGGVPSALISLAMKYMHTTVETVHKEDVENTIKLMYQALLKIEKDHNFKYL